MKTFQINKNIEVVCEWQNTRYGFRHLATLLIKGNEVDTAKCCYYNRTWERYEFESVLKKLANKTKVFDDSKKEEFNAFIKNQGVVESKEVDKQFKNISNVMALGEIFGQTQKEKNDWKVRMLKAGLGGKGLIMPDDWNELDEDTKEKRLNGNIKVHQN